MRADLATVDAFAKSVQNESKVFINKLENEYTNAMNRISTEFTVLDASIGEMASGMKMMASSGTAGMYQTMADNQQK